MNLDHWGHVATRLANGQVIAAGGVFLGPITSTELYNPGIKTWTFTGSMNSHHVYDTASLLPSGKVLAVSGYYNSSAELTTNATEFYDPVAANWTYGPPVNNGRAFHTTTVLPGGQLVLVGGTSGTNYLSSIETLEQTNGGWTTVNSMSAQRYIPTLTLLTNGQALAAGGVSDTDVPANTEVYNPATGNWTTTPGAMSTGRYLAAATPLANGEVLIVGGFNSSNYLASAEVFNPATGLWTLTTNPMNVTRGSHTVTLLDNGQVLVAGGLNTSTNSLATAEIYNPAAGTWTLTGSLVTPRSEHTATLLPNGQVLVAGGFHTNYLQDTETYNPFTGVWTTNNPMNSARLAHTATLLPSGKVLVAGGYNGRSFLQSAELFDPSTGIWTFTGPMNVARRYHTATLLPGGQVLVAGGDAGAAALTSSELYDPATGTWLLVNPLNTGRSRGAATLLPNGETLMIGGYTGTNFNDLNSAEVFDPGLGFSAAWQPQMSGLTSPLTLTGSLVVTGAQFRGISEASGGNASQDSPADYPIVQLMSLGNGQSRFINVTNWTTNGLATAPVTNFPAGPALATVFANGIASQSAFLQVQQARATITLSNLVQFFDNSGISVSATTVPPGLPLYVTYNGSSTLPTNVSSYTVVATISDPDYQGMVTNILEIEGRNFGVDVSHFQNSNGIPETNWTQMFAQGTTFAFVKATEGLTGANDPAMATNVARATQAGLLVSVYHFAHPESRPTTNGAVQEATNFLTYAGGAIGPGMLRPVLDIETGAGVLSATQMTDWVLAFSQEVVSSRGAGAAPIIYCLQSYANTNFDSRLAGNALWINAAGGGNPAFSNPPANGFLSATGVFTNWAFWQYNISGAAGGISPIDLDVCHDDFQPLSSYLIPVLKGSIEIQGASATSGGFQLSLTNIPGTHFTVLTSTNVSVPSTNWQVIGAASEISPGHYQFTDSQKTNFPQRFYRVRWPQ
jgi:GH25 family lysozyme M1 (1,4-beta-N-acetylmuramidase)